MLAGQTALSALVRNQAREFTAVIGIAVGVRVTGTERPLPLTTVTEVDRVLQEALANVYRQGQADAGEVSLTHDTTFGSDEAVMAGAAGLLLKNAGRTQLLRAAREVAQGRSPLDAAVPDT